MTFFIHPSISTERLHLWTTLCIFWQSDYCRSPVLCCVCFDCKEICVLLILNVNLNTEFLCIYILTCTYCIELFFFFCFFVVTDFNQNWSTLKLDFFNVHHSTLHSEKQLYSFVHRQSNTKILFMTTSLTRSPYSSIIHLIKHLMNYTNCHKPDLFSLHVY